MKTKSALKYFWILTAAILTATATSSVPLQKTKEDCSISAGQAVVRWKDMYWFPCKYSWNGICIWPIRRKHSVYKVTVTEGVPVREENGNVIPVADGEIREWKTYDAKDWNALPNYPNEYRKYVHFEPIADNEYVVIVETRYRLFHNVEETLRICVTQP